MSRTSRVRHQINALRNWEPNQDEQIKSQIFSNGSESIWITRWDTLCLSSHPLRPSSPTWIYMIHHLELWMEPTWWSHTITLDSLLRRWTRSRFDPGCEKSGEISWDHLIITSCPRDPPRVAQILAALLSDHWFHCNDWSPDLSLSWLQSPSESKFLLIPSQHVQPTSFWIFLKLDPMHNHGLSEYDAATKLIPAKTCSR